MNPVVGEDLKVAGLLARVVGKGGGLASIVREASEGSRAEGAGFVAQANSIVRIFRLAGWINETRLNASPIVAAFAALEARKLERTGEGVK